MPSWLKGLRLHKYAHLFSLLSYDEMLQLTEEQLEMQNVTKGARHKIALSIQRLRDRPNLLCQLEKVGTGPVVGCRVKLLILCVHAFYPQKQEVVETGAIHNALNGLKNILSTPIKPYHGPAAGDEPLFDDCLSPPPSLIRDDTSGCSSLDGSTDSLAPRLDGTDFKSNSPNFASMAAMLASGAAKSSDMPTVIVSAAPDTDSGGECSDDTSGDDCMNDASHSHFPYSLTGDTDIGPANLPQDDLAGRITRLLGKSKFHVQPFVLVFIGCRCCCYCCCCCCCCCCCFLLDMKMTVTNHLSCPLSSTTAIFIGDFLVIRNWR